MKYLEKAAGILNDIFDGCLVLLCLCVLMIGSYTMYDIYMLYHTADNTSLLRYKPGEEIRSEIIHYPGVFSWTQGTRHCSQTNIPSSTGTICQETQCSERWTNI